MTRPKGCPFCGGTEVRVDEKKYWTGMKYIVLSVELLHWCELGGGFLSNFIKMRGKTEKEVRDLWEEGLM